jgi:hypothetical protein
MIIWKEYRHLRILWEQLEEHIGIETQTKILSGIDYIKDSSTPDVKAQWASEIVKE